MKHQMLDWLDKDKIAYIDKACDWDIDIGLRHSQKIIKFSDINVVNCQPCLEKKFPKELYEPL